MTAVLILSAVSLAAWVYLLLFRGSFWLMRERDDGIAANAVWPSVTAVVPARDEAEAIAQSIPSLLGQDYPGPFNVVLVDDQSTDGTARIARDLDENGRLTIIAGSAPPSGWTGKLWAVKQGIALAGDGAPRYLWLTDADIVHAPDCLRSLVARAQTNNLVLVSLMAKLRCEDFAERFLIPGFVFFFAMLYPFAWVNRKENTLAAAAGGCMLVNREALERAGGIDSIRSEIIDDCALARRMKAEGGIWLGLTERAVSLRCYPKISDVGGMISRSAYAQLRHSPLLLVATLIGMILVYVAPLLITFSPTSAVGLEAGLIGATSWLAMAMAFQPILAFYGRSSVWGVALPLIGVVYAAFTLHSAIQHWRGHGGMWKGRAQAWTEA
jgi:hopene-associated glycosyltransferase HpnB